jgi:hypothetical protein
LGADRSVPFHLKLAINCAESSNACALFNQRKESVVKLATGIESPVGQKSQDDDHALHIFVTPTVISVFQHDSKPIRRLGQYVDDAIVEES